MPAADRPRRSLTTVKQKTNDPETDITSKIVKTKPVDVCEKENITPVPSFPRRSLRRHSLLWQVEQNYQFKSDVAPPAAKRPRRSANDQDIFRSVDTNIVDESVNIKPGNIAGVKNTRSTLELRSGSSKRLRLPMKFDQKDTENITPASTLLRKSLRKHAPSWKIQEKDNLEEAITSPVAKRPRRSSTKPVIFQAAPVKPEPKASLDVDNLPQNAIKENIVRRVGRPRKSRESGKNDSGAKIKLMSGSIAGTKRNREENSTPKDRRRSSRPRVPSLKMMESLENQKPVRKSYEKRRTSIEGSESMHTSGISVGEQGFPFVVDIEPRWIPQPNPMIQVRRMYNSAAYIESVSGRRQTSVSQWQRSLNSSFHNVLSTPRLGRPITNAFSILQRNAEEEHVKAMWRLRDQMVEACLGISTMRLADGRLF